MTDQAHRHNVEEGDSHHFEHMTARDPLPKNKQGREPLN